MPRFPFLHFIPVPVRPRRDGWTPVLQIRFVIGIAKGLSPARAAARLGKTRQSAQALRRHPGGRSFAAAWDCARRFARDRAGERTSRGFMTPPPSNSSPALRGRGGTQAEGLGGEGLAESGVQTLTSHRCAVGPSSPVKDGRGL
jgi:hypothetical protein